MLLSSCSVTAVCAGGGDKMPGFVDVLYKHIVPACFGAPLQHSFDLNDGNAFVVGWRREGEGEGIEDMMAVCCSLQALGEISGLLLSVISQRVSCEGCYS